jgi:hypothetical protein
MSDAASQARPHGDMPQHLRDYWTKGEGAAKIGWGTPGDFYKCRIELGRYLAGSHADINGLCENLHEVATGMSTAEHAELLKAKGRDHPSTAAEAITARIHGRE